MISRPRFVIGVPTVSRSRPYLLETLTSIVEGMQVEDWNHTRLVIFDGDVGSSGGQPRNAILNRFASLSEAGVLVVASRATAVPQGPCSDKARWQRKQALDCAALFDLCLGGGDYYLHLEDDVVASPGFLATIEARIAEHRAARRRWGILSFYNSFAIADGTRYSEFALTRRYFGLIGQVVRVEDLGPLAHYVRSHHTEGPIDVLVARWALAGGRAVVAHAPSLFQHVGVVSSYQSRIQLWDTPQFVEGREERRRRLATALGDVESHHPGASKSFTSHRRVMRRIQRAPRQGL